MNAVATVPAKPPGVLASIASRYQMDADAFKATVKGTVFPQTGTNEELAAFLMVANEYRLNPITREIYAFPKKGGGIVPIVSIDGWISLVNSHPKFKGMEFEAHTSDKGVLIAYTCRIFRTDREMPTVITEYLDECIRSTDPWKMRHRMLRHKALIQCARYAFGFSGIYDEDEGTIIAETRDVSQPPAGARKPPTPPKQIAAPVVEAEPVVEQQDGGATEEQAAHDPETGEIAQEQAAGPAPTEAKQEPVKVTSGSAAPAEQQDTAKASRRPRGWAKLFEHARIVIEDGKFTKDADGFATVGELAADGDIADADLVLKDNVIVKNEVVLPGAEPAVDPAAAMAKFERDFAAADSIDALNAAAQANEAAYLKLKAAGQHEPADKLFRAAEARILKADAEAEMSAGKLADPVSAEERGQPADDDFPGDRPSANAAPVKPEKMGLPELEQHIRSYIMGATNADDLKKRWYMDDELREKLPEKVRAELRTLWKVRMEDLRAAEGQG